MSTKEAQESIAQIMRKWQRVENSAVKSTAEIIDQTDNPVLRMVMEIIQRDSHMHYRVQEMIADSIERSPLTLSPEEISKVWTLVEKHIEIEKQTIQLAESCLAETEGKKGLTLQRYLLEYLITDEKKHDSILANMEAIKGNMYP